MAGGAERLESAGFGGGRLIVGATGRSEARYFVTDYLGSVRVVLDAAGGVLERNDYYPFGLRWAVADQPVSDNRYRFHGKESQSFLSVPYHDYGARQYDPELALWRVVDPLLEADPSVSPYAFCGNNPVINVDPDGRIWDIVWDLLNLGYDVGAATYNEIKGDRKAAEVHWDDAKLDLIAALIPFVPAGASKGVRIANKALDAVRATDRTVDAARAVDHAADAARVLDQTAETTEGVIKTVDQVEGATKRTFQTYTKTNPTTGRIYSGRTSGLNSPEKNVFNRDRNHHMNKKGYGPARLDRTSSNPNAIRGREQQLIEQHGGAIKSGGSSGNTINGINPANPKSDIYEQARIKEFGE